MPSESLTVRTMMLVFGIIVLSLFFLSSGFKGLLSAFSSFFMAIGALAFLAMFIVPGGSENIAIGGIIAISFLIGGFLIGGTSGIMSIISFLVVFSFALIVVYGLTPRNNPEKHRLLLVIAAGFIVLATSGLVSKEANSAVMGIILSLLLSGVVAISISYVSKKSDSLLWGILIALLVIFGGLSLILGGISMFSGFVIILAVSLAISFVFPDSVSSEESVSSWLGTGSMLFFVFLLGSVQGLLPGLLRTFALFVLFSGLFTIAFFLRIGEREIPGITNAGLLLGTVLTLLGLYFILF